MRYSASEKYEIIQRKSRILSLNSVFIACYWGWYYLSTILHDYSRYIIAWRLCTSMGASDVKDILDDALNFTGLDHVKVNHKPRLLSDNGPCYISGELAEYLKDNDMAHHAADPIIHKHKVR